MVYHIISSSYISGALLLHFTEEDLNFKFAILVAGFKSRSQPHDALYQVPIEIPTLHVYGETDQVIEQRNYHFNIYIKLYHKLVFII